VLVSECGVGYDGVSASGEVVLFTADAADRGPGGKSCNEAGEGSGPAVNELYARVGGAQTVKISGGEAAEFMGSSEDASEVFFKEGGALYEYDFDAPEGQRVTPVAAGVSSVLAVSRDGSHVYFTTPGEPTSGPNANGETPGEVNGEKLFVYDAQTHSPPVFVAGEPNAGQTTRDGQYLVFSASRQLVGTDDTSSVEQLFEYDTATGAVVRVSVGEKSAAGFECPATRAFEEGFNCDGNTESSEELPKLTPASEGGPPAGTSGLSVAEDGVVAFSSPLTLTPQAQPGQPVLLEGVVVGETENIYEYRAGNVYLISAADEAAPLREPEGASRLLGLDESGRDVFFATTDSLVPQDSDTQSSWYDAREEGGFPGPTPPAGCEGEACQGSGNPPPPLATPLAPPTANENLVEPAAAKPSIKPKAKSLRCKKGFIKKNNKCVKNKKKTKAKKAINNGRTKS